MSFILWPPNVSEIRTIISLSIFSSSSTVFVHNISDIYFSYKRQLRQLLCLNDWFWHPRFFCSRCRFIKYHLFSLPHTKLEILPMSNDYPDFQSVWKPVLSSACNFLFYTTYTSRFSKHEKKETSILKGFLFSFSNAEDGTWTHTLAMSTRSLVLLVCQFRHFRMSVISRDDFLIIAKKNKKVNHFFQKNCKKFFIQLKQFFQKKSWLIL